MGPFWWAINTNPQSEGNPGQLRGINPPPDSQRQRFVIKLSSNSASQNPNYSVVSQAHESWHFFFFCICPQSFKNNIRGNRLKRAFDLALIEVASFLLLLHRSRLMCGATANHPVPLNHSHGLYGGFNQLTISTFVVARLKIQPLPPPPPIMRSVVGQTQVMKKAVWVHLPTVGANPTIFITNPSAEKEVLFQRQPSCLLSLWCTDMLVDSAPPPTCLFRNVIIQTVDP